VRPSGLLSIAATELNGKPVALTPMRSRARGRAYRRAHEREDERLRDAHDREFDFRVARRIDVAADVRDANPESIGRDREERRIDVREPAVRARPVAIVRIGYGLADGG